MILRLEETESTNSYAKEHIDTLNDKTVVHALHQTKGRGRLNRSWVDLGNENLFISIVLKPSQEYKNNFPNITQYAGVVLCNVLEKYVEQGEFVTAGKPLFKMADIRHIIMRAYVTSAQLQQIKVGQQVKVLADYGNKQIKEYTGTITWISNQSEFTPKTIVTDDERADLVYAIKIAVDNTDGGIKMGMYGKVKLI